MKYLFDGFKIIGTILLLFIVVVFAQNIGIVWHALHLYSFEYILHGATYLTVALLLFKFVANKIYKRNLAYFRITRFKFIKVCVILGLLLPVTVISFYLIFVPGHWIVTSLKSHQEYSEMMIEIIFLGGIVAPMVEEMMFRGFLLKYIEEKTNIYVALSLTSVLFGAIHLVNGKLTGVSLIMLVAAGTSVGLMYGLAAYKFNTVWASIPLHMFWNMSSIITVTDHNMDYGVFQYIIKPNNPFITGGAYGMDASGISIIGYITVAVIFIYWRRFQLIEK
ncbi:CPBP family intramembrane metalloprotease [Staphylococcus condimenti]|uniref:CPBP family intramembrane metalloprotease n=1 Tax=Staphylococcus condimenti TaxID=70255 RepID=A0A143PC68_9STAP|nr:type II CAAX endopeptidase family protein [Staphylococcus condimenti]AMY05873.1 CAAX protease [Staphylococcus condimenti]MDK8644860.1 type II CAAX endopeptidase family protein [Staphylococcus condimenti]PNZ61606.1 CPBP family intramembrane metalloprotease [Staphylococcus condimenti]QQS82326.1 CPBP family intramembrane metalloprotease [Staphylococcus condimenti]QRP95313.1 CPBP family intramembrane metalloprotease [Staphylococcus condimenti]